MHEGRQLPEHAPQRRPLFPGRGRDVRLRARHRGVALHPVPGLLAGGGAGGDDCGAEELDVRGRLMGGLDARGQGGEHLRVLVTVDRSHGVVRVFAAGLHHPGGGHGVLPAVPQAGALRMSSTRRLSDGLACPLHRFPRPRRIHGEAGPGGHRSRGSRPTRAEEGARHGAAAAGGGRRLKVHSRRHRQARHHPRRLTRGAACGAGRWPCIHAGRQVGGRNGEEHLAAAGHEAGGRRADRRDPRADVRHQVDVARRQARHHRRG
mmetsp:Transcript_54075/g.156180  ORF Transcript_54075/g.156180 Transcript_54075/m.156180 type:complete len:263 (-) Transcript_54075:639-1427(-)